MADRANQHTCKERKVACCVAHAVPREQPPEYRTWSAWSCPPGPASCAHVSPLPPHPSAHLSASSASLHGRSCATSPPASAPIPGPCRAAASTPCLPTDRHGAVLTPRPSQACTRLLRRRAGDLPQRPSAPERPGRRAVQPCSQPSHTPHASRWCTVARQC